MKTIMVTGTSRGIGRTTARQLLQNGNRVLSCARSAKQADFEPRHKNLHAISLDLNRTESIQAVVNHLTTNNIQLDCLVNNAAVYDGSAAEVLQTNVFAVALLTVGLSDRLSPGQIVNVSSGMGALSGCSSSLAGRLLNPALEKDELFKLLHEYIKHGSGGWPANPYSASKAALNTLSRIWQRDYSLKHISTVSICPGWVRTDMGGTSAPRSVEKGAETIIWAAENNPPGGRFYRDKKEIDW